MTLYFSGADDNRNGDEGKQQIIENHPHYVEIDDEGRLVINIDEIEREEKKKQWANVGAQAADSSDEYDVVTEPEVEWTG